MSTVEQMYALYVSSKHSWAAYRYPSWHISVPSFIIYFTVLRPDRHEQKGHLLPFIHYSLDVSPVGTLTVTVSLLPIIHIHSKRPNRFPKRRRAYPLGKSLLFSFTLHDCTVEEWSYVVFDDIKEEGHLYWSLGDYKPTLIPAGTLFVRYQKVKYPDKKENGRTNKDVRNIPNAFRNFHPQNQGRRSKGYGWSKHPDRMACTQIRKSKLSLRLARVQFVPSRDVGTRERKHDFGKGLVLKARLILYLQYIGRKYDVE